MRTKQCAKCIMVPAIKQMLGFVKKMLMQFSQFPRGQKYTCSQLMFTIGQTLFKIRIIFSLTEHFEFYMCIFIKDILLAYWHVAMLSHHYVERVTGRRLRELGLRESRVNHRTIGVIRIYTCIQLYILNLISHIMLVHVPSFPW